MAADLDRDGRSELVFGTYGSAPRSGRLIVLSARGRRLHEVLLRAHGEDGNGIGVPAAPSIADIDRDGRLEIVVSTFEPETAPAAGDRIEILYDPSDPANFEPA